MLAALILLQIQSPFMLSRADLTNGFALGVQAWTFNRGTAYEAIEKVHAVGGKLIEFYPGQRLSADDPNGIGPEMSEAENTALKQQLARFQVKAVAFGVTGVSR